MIVQTLPLGQLQANCYLATKDEASPVVVIDPGDDMLALTRALKGRQVAGVLITHAHFDHILGLPAVSQAPVYVHALDAPALSDSALSLCPPGTPPLIAGAPRTVEEGDVIALGRLTFTVLHTPGHTVGSVCYRCGGALFSGDTLFYPGYGRTDLPGGSWQQMAASLHRLLAIREDLTVYPGHGDAGPLSAIREAL